VNFLAGYERFGPLKKVEIPHDERLSIVAPHPDDESIGCGGLIALWPKKETPVDVVFLTAGGLGSVAARDAESSAKERKISVLETSEVRRIEAKAALRILEAQGTWFDGTDGSLFADEDRLVGQLSDHWRKNRPDIIAAPHPADRHCDHAFAAAIVARAASNVLDPDTLILGYEVWSPAPVNSVLDISPVAEKKWEAIAQHTSQTATTDYVAAARALATYRAISSGQKMGFAEAFYLQTVKDYTQLVGQLKV